MPNRNTDLHVAKRKKLDEFYTQTADIELELANYREYLRCKSIFCNCDDPEYSNFWRYFEANFDFLELKCLVATHYEREKPSYKVEKSAGARPPAKKKLKQNGDFRSPEAISMMEASDLIVTNPPFSLFREYVGLLIKHDKKFIIMGNINAVTYKEIFPLIRENKIWLGPSIHSGDREFEIPKRYCPLLKRYRIDEQGRAFTSIKGVRWFTNVDHKKRHEELILYKHYTPEEYPKYDNYDAINVDKVADIPCDYDGVMGVPITFLDKYNPEQFEILGCSYSYGEPIGYHYDGKDYSVSISRKNVYKRLFIRRKYQ